MQKQEQEQKHTQRQEQTQKMQQQKQTQAQTQNKQQQFLQQFLVASCSLASLPSLPCYGKSDAYADEADSHARQQRRQ